MRARFVSFLVTLLTLSFLSERAHAAPTVVTVRVDSAITQITADYIEAGIRKAEETQASAFLIELDTPGGLLDATRRIVKSMLAAKVPVVCYISPSGARAGSAGVFITLASHLAVMAPTSNIGAAHPVGMFGGDVEGNMGKKVENDTVAWARSLANTHGRNADWAEKAVRESESLTAQEALDSYVVELLAADVNELLTKATGKKVKLGEQEVELRLEGATLIPFELTGPQKVGSFLANPNLTYILLIVGLLGIFLEVKNPGMIIPGVVGGICLVLVFGVQALPINWLGAVLILGAAVLLIAELYVTSFGILTALALLFLVSGSYLLFDVPGSAVGVDPLLIWTLAFSFVAIALAFGYFIVRIQRQAPATGAESMAGEVGSVWESIAPERPGRVFLRGSYWVAEASEELPAGTPVRVVRMQGTRALVTRATPRS